MAKARAMKRSPRRRKTKATTEPLKISSNAETGANRPAEVLAPWAGGNGANRPHFPTGRQIQD
jgi:hypothetical protein